MTHSILPAPRDTTDYGTSGVDTAVLYLIRHRRQLPDGRLYPAVAVLAGKHHDADLTAAVVDLETAVAARDLGGTRAALAALHALPVRPCRGDLALRRVGDNLLANPTRLPVTILDRDQNGRTLTVTRDGHIQEAPAGQIALDRIAVYVDVPTVDGAP